MRLTQSNTPGGGMRRWSRPVPPVFVGVVLLFGLVLLGWGVIELRAEPAASVVTIDDSAAEPVPPRTGPASESTAAAGTAAPPAAAPVATATPTAAVPAGANSAAAPASKGFPSAVSVGSAPPSTVTLPGVDTSVPIVPVGVLPTRALQLPEHPGAIGWWSAGPLPGSAQGTVVLAGHVDSAKYGVGPLRQLLTDELRGPIDVLDTEGVVHRYTVSSRRSYPKAALSGDLFTGSGPPQLALITCSGPFDQRTGHYADNVVVLAKPAP